MKGTKTRSLYCPVFWSLITITIERFSTERKSKWKANAPNDGQFTSPTQLIKPNHHVIPQSYSATQFLQNLTPFSGVQVEIFHHNTSRKQELRSR